VETRALGYSMTFDYKGQTYDLLTKRGEVTGQELFKHPDGWHWMSTPEKAVQSYLAEQRVRTKRTT
jgi:hypothetical protein